MNFQTEDKPGLPLVTVVVPTLNRPTYLAEALRRAVGQTYTNLEILVRDNASETATAEVVEAFHDPRIHYVRHPENIGMTLNVLSGFRAARGKYVTNLHDDDLWEPDFISKMVEVLEANHEAVLAFCDHHIINRSGEIETRATEKNSSYFGRSGLAPGIHRPFKELALIHLSIPMAMAVLLRRDAIDWNDFPNLICAYDFWLVYLACRDGGACYYLPERLTSYRVHAASESTLGRVRLNQGFIEIYVAMLRDPRVAEFHEAFRRRLGIHHTETAVAQLRHGNREEARKMLKAGMKYCLEIKACLTYLVSYLPDAISQKLPGKLRFPVSGQADTTSNI